MIRLIVILICGAIVAAAGLFGLLYDPGHPWMDKKRTIGVWVLCIAGAIELSAILFGQL